MTTNSPITASQLLALQTSSREWSEALRAAQEDLSDPRYCGPRRDIPALTAARDEARAKYQAAWDEAGDVWCVTVIGSGRWSGPSSWRQAWEDQREASRLGHTAEVYRPE